ncbi:MAG: winged helix-turn-helix transcriptional regulator [Halobacteriales archaeon]|nr:winged helix-turn-helix transcriptional regulator [Halobacteriales archaeon]
MALILLPAALADTQSPVTIQPNYDYSADAGALLAQVGGAHPSVQATFTWTKATAYEVRLPGLALTGTKGQDVPVVVSVTPLGPGALQLDPQRAAELLVLTDPHGLSVAQLPVNAPADPARLVVGVADLLGDPSSLDPQDLRVSPSITYTIPGMLADRPVEARADGGLLALFAQGPVQLSGGHIPYARELGQGVDGERFLLLQAEGAHLVLQGSGLAAVLQLPQASAGAGLASQVLGLHAQQRGDVASGAQGLSVAQRADLLGALLGTQAAPGSRDSGAQAGGVAPLDAQAAAVGMALGGAAALVAVGIAALALYGKTGLLGLLAPLYARLQHDEVLNNGARESIYRHIVANPGVNVSEVVKRFGLGWGATVYHLRVLERNHLVSTARHGRQVCYFQNGGAYAGQMQGISAVRNGNAALVARTILEQPGLAQRDLCARTRLAQPTVSWHLQRLEEAGLVLAQGAGRKRYHPTEQLRAIEERGLLAQRDASTVAPSASAPSNVMNA